MELVEVQDTCQRPTSVSADSAKSAARRLLQLALLLERLSEQEAFHTAKAKLGPPGYCSRF